MRSPNKEIKEHQLFISNIFVWFKLLRDNKIEWKFLNKILRISLISLITTPFQLLQQVYLFPLKIRKKELDHDPVFIIGHWRSGTTHLHYIMNLDDQFICLENYQAFFYRVAFIGKFILRPFLQAFIPKKGPQDNIEIDAYSPCEEEHPLTNLTTLSGMQSFFYNKNLSYFNQGNLFKGMSETQKTKWINRYHNMLIQIPWFHQSTKQLLLKTPHNTARIELLIKRYPKAKIIFIHRNPLDVYNSMNHLYKKTISTQLLQEANHDVIQENIFYFYKSTIKGYLKNRSKIPENQLIEISFKNLEENLIDTISNIYHKLDIKGFNDLKPKLEDYKMKLNNYKKNTFSDIPIPIQEKLRTEWDIAFKEWGY